MLFVIVALSVSADDARHSSDAINFEIPIVSGVEKYTEFLSFPAYLVVALQNNGINASNPVSYTHLTLPTILRV